MGKAEKDDWEESEEKPQDEVAETPEQQAEEEKAGTEEHAAPTEDELKENEWMNAVKSLVTKNAGVENADAICAFFKDNMSKAKGDVISMPIDEVKKSNPKLAACMEKRGFRSINLKHGKGKSGNRSIALGVRG